MTDVGRPAQRVVRAIWHTPKPVVAADEGPAYGAGTALALACDRVVERGDDLDFANVLVDDLSAHAIVDDDGARWSNHEHRATPSDLEPRPGWAMGNAGILRELLRYARISSDGDPAYAVACPDHPALTEK